MTHPDKDTLFLLLPGFEDNDRREFCPECAELWGVLSYYPAIKDSLEIVPVGIHHPRAPIVEQLGDGRHNAPTLILARDTMHYDDRAISVANGHRYLSKARDIAKYWSHRFGTPVPRGS